jgi:hypothetical protein
MAEEIEASAAGCGEGVEFMKLLPEAKTHFALSIQKTF